MKKSNSKTLKITITILISICMVLMLLGGCSGNSAGQGNKDNTTASKDIKDNETTTKDSPKVEVDSVGDPKVDLGGRIFNVMGTAPDPETEAGQNRLVRLEEIKKWYNCDINFVEGTNEVYDTFYASILSGDPILDVSGVGHIGWFFENVGSNMYYPVSDLKAININDTNRWNIGICDMYTYNGKNYGLAEKGILWGQGLFVNIDLLKRSGVTENIYDLQRDGQWTWDKFLEICRKVNKIGSDGTTEIWGVVDNSCILLENLIVSFGGSIVEERDGKYTSGLDSPKALAALTFYQDLSIKEKVFLPQLDETRNYGELLFKAGKAGFTPGYPWFGANYADMADNYAYVRFPMKDASIGTVAVFDWPSCFIIPATVKDPQAVGVFANAFFAPDPKLSIDVQIEQAKEAWSPWFRDSRALDETCMSYWKDNKLNFQQFLMLFNGDEQWSIMNPFYNKIAIGEKTPASAAEELVPQMNAVIEKKITNKKN